MTRRVAFDTETTGLSPAEGHRLTEIGCVEIIDRKITGDSFQTYINPERDVDEGAVAITGLTREFLQDKPLFKEVVNEFIDFIAGAELIVHNAPFDIGFMKHELQLLNHPWCDLLEEKVEIVDTLPLARSLHPGQRNSLDALCKRYAIDNSEREYHGALLDAQLLAHVYLAMTMGQTTMALTQTDIAHSATESLTNTSNRVLSGLTKKYNLRVINADEAELKAHQDYIASLLEKDSK